MTRALAPTGQARSLAPFMRHVRFRKPDVDLTIRGFRQRLASIDAVPQFALLGVIAGIVTGALILLFRSLIEWPLSVILKISRCWDPCPASHCLLPGRLYSD